MKAEQRVGVFVDVQNLYYTARNVYNARVNFTNILKDAVGERPLVKAIAYGIKLAGYLTIAAGAFLSIRYSWKVTEAEQVISTNSGSLI